MRRALWQGLLGLLLIGLTLGLGWLHYAGFHDARTLLFYLALDVVFIPIQVLVVTLILDQLLSWREQQAVRDNLDRMVGVFYNELGTELLKRLAQFGPAAEQVGPKLQVTRAWTTRDFQRLAKELRQTRFALRSQDGPLALLKTFMERQRGFLLRLLQNPDLHEHERFTELLWAVFHLEDELAHRSQFKRLPPSDLEHLSGDLQRVYALLVAEWLHYLNHLREHYPYLFSLALRTNPFDPQASIVVKKT